MNEARELPNWEQIYQERPVESMPWFNPHLDADLEQSLSELNIVQGTVLDLGTGPATQAIALGERGFVVVGTDLSGAAVEQARQRVQSLDLQVTFQQDDILNSQLHQVFDVVFDRGCFHVLSPKRRQEYVNTVQRLVKPGGYLFLKCFSAREPRQAGPYHFTPTAIAEIFTPQFSVTSIQETVYQGPLDPLPLALFCVLKRVESANV